MSWSSDLQGERRRVSSVANLGCSCVKQQKHATIVTNKKVWMPGVVIGGHTATVCSVGSTLSEKNPLDTKLVSEWNFLCVLLQTRKFESFFLLRDPLKSDLSIFRELSSLFNFVFVLRFYAWKFLQVKILRNRINLYEEQWGRRSRED